MLRTLGVTGGIGSGKTTVCRMLEEKGARLFNADLAARRIMAEDADVRREVQEAFGRESYREGVLDRPFVASKVFGDADALKRLNAIVHPRVFAAFEDVKSGLAAEGAPLLLHESAILFESGAAEHVDEVLVVHAPEEVRVARAAARDGVTAGAVRARMAHQLSQDAMLSRADYRIENAGSAEALQEQVDRLFERIMRKAA